MTCARYPDADIIELAERYVNGVLPREEEASFEEHYLGCDACLATVRGIEDVRDRLLAARHAAAGARVAPVDIRTLPRGHARRRGRRPRARWTWAAAAAIAAMLLLALFWRQAIAPSPQHPLVAQGTPIAEPKTGLRPPAPPPTPPPSVETPGGTGAVVDAPGDSTARGAVPSTSGSPTPGAAMSGAAGAGQSASPSPASRARSELIASLAIVVPPPYVAVPVRSDDTADAVATQQAFAAAMARYRAQDYRGAADRLRAVVATQRDMTAAPFFLGIAELMLRRPAPATRALQRVADSGATPFADEAHFYLAKAALQREDLATAERELAHAVAADAGPGDEARTLLQQVRSLLAEAPHDR